MLGAITDAEQNGAEQKRLIARGRQISEELPTLVPDAIRSIFIMLVSRVDIKAEHIEILVYRQRLHDLLQAQSIDLRRLALQLPTNWAEQRKMLGFEGA